MGPGGGRGLAQQQDGEQQQQQEAQDRCGNQQMPRDPELLGLGVPGAQAEVAPDWPPHRNQLPLHRHQRELSVWLGGAALRRASWNVSRVRVSQKDGEISRDVDLCFLLFLSSGQPGATTMSLQASSLCLAPICP